MTEQKNGHSNLREELSLLAGSDATLERMLKMNRPLNLTTYLEMEYPEGAPKTLSSEQWSMIPEPLRKASESQETELDAKRLGALRVARWRHQNKQMRKKR
jgi:hypothetical protein